MFIKFADITEFSTNRIEAVSTATASTTKGLQAIAAEALDYSKKSFKSSQAFAEKLLRVREPYELIALQSNFAKATYDDFSARAAKIGELYSELSKEAFGTLLNGASKSEKAVEVKVGAAIPVRSIESKIK